MQAAFPEPGDLFVERYRIDEVLNQGGFGCVYRATQVELNRAVAIKILRPASRIGFNDNEEDEARRLKVVAKRFEREAQVVSQLRDPRTVMMYDYGTTDDGLLYMVLEYVDGQPLSVLVREEGAFAPGRAVKIAEQVMLSLQEAHALGMLHRDIKPPNIMLFEHVGRRDQVKVLDFGLAKSIDDPQFTADNPDLTDAEVLIGTPRYMSPEQIRGEKLGPATDIYSLGLVLYELLTGHKAITSTSTMNTLARHINDVPIVLPDSLNVPEKLRSVVNRMLSKDLDHRYQSVDEVMRELETWNTADLPVLELTDMSEEFFSPLEPELDEEDDNRKTYAMIGGAIALVVIVLLAFIFISGGEDDASATNGGTATIGAPTPTPTPPEPAKVAAETEKKAEDAIAVVAEQDAGIGDEMVFGEPDESPDAGVGDDGLVLGENAVEEPVEEPAQVETPTPPRETKKPIRRKKPTKPKLKLRTLK